MRAARRMAMALSCGTFVALSIGACENFASNHIGEGLGTKCAADTDCQASKCTGGICAIPCGGGCPSGTGCAAGICQVPLGVGLLYPGEVAQQAYTLSLDRGRSDAGSALPYASLTFTEDVQLASDVQPAVENLLGQGRSVIIGGDSFPSYATVISSFADQHPNDWFLIAGSRVTRANLVSFDVRTYQAYYLAGLAAAKKTVTHRLGMIGSTYAPPTVADINAFALGAQSVNPATIVELDWIGDHHDMNPPVGGKSRERTFTDAPHRARMATSSRPRSTTTFRFRRSAKKSRLVSCRSARTSSMRATSLPRRASAPSISIGAPCSRSSSTRCTSRRSRRTRAFSTSIQVSSTDSVVGFRVNDGLVGAPAIASDVDIALTNVAADQGVGRVFDGPIHSAACEAMKMVPVCVPMGARLDDQGLDTMCWLVDGIVTKNMSGMDVAATVPMDPNQDCGMLATMK